jgi:hypothetical protein
VISERLARAYWGDEDPVGSTMERVWGGDASSDHGEPAGGRQPATTRVVGVVEDTVTGLRPGLQPPATVYAPVDVSRFPRLVVRVRDDARGRAASVWDALRSVDPDVGGPPTSFASDGVDRDLQVPRTFAGLAAMIGLTAVALAVVGLFGVTAFVTGQRRHEISVRMALGADRGAIVRLLLRDSLTPVAVGLACGVGVAVLAGQVVQGVLYGVSARDPIALATAICVLFGVAVAAVLPTLYRAARVDLAALLRQ